MFVYSLFAVKPCLGSEQCICASGPTLVAQNCRSGWPPVSTTATAIVAGVAEAPPQPRLALEKDSERCLFDLLGLEDGGRTDMPAGSGATRATQGDAISVYWPLDKTWYDGRIESFDAVSGDCEVLYDDGERQTLNLFKQTKYKCKVKQGVRVVELIDIVRAVDGDVSKQLKHIGDALRSMCKCRFAFCDFRFAVFFYFYFLFGVSAGRTALE